MSSPNRFVSGIVLAAGGASRMGRPKQLLPLAGRPLLQHVLDAGLASGLGELILVLGCASQELRAALSWPDGARVRVAVAPDWAEGVSASLRLGLRLCDGRAVAAAVLLGDQPGVGAERIDRMIDAFFEAGAPAARPVYRGAGGESLPGHPVLLARRLWPAVEALRGDAGASQLLAEHPEWLASIPFPGDPPADVDRPEDYQRLTDAPH